jgi:hypothetical protein
MTNKPNLEKLIDLTINQFANQDLKTRIRFVSFAGIILALAVSVAAYSFFRQIVPLKVDEQLKPVPFYQLLWRDNTPSDEGATRKIKP